MASWKRFFSQTPSNLSPLGGQGEGSIASANSPNKNFCSFLPEVYAGPPNRIERYGQYEDMDRDPIVNAGLNVVAEFCTQDNEHTNLPFSIKFKDDATDSEKKTLEETLKKWCYINDFKTKTFHIVRKVLVYGDCIFVRDPETFEWEYVDPKNVEKVVVDELKGKDPEAYFIRDLDLNLTSKVMTTQKNSGEAFVPGGIPTGGTANYPGQQTFRQGANTSRFTKGSHTEEIPGEHIIHLSMNTGLEAFWPFGNSILEPVFKSYKQKQLLEDSMVIYRVQRAPERRVFKIHTGTLPSHKAMAYVERVKNEIQQRRIPSRTGGGSQIMDSSYNPLCLALDTKIPLLDGRTLELNELITEYKSGKENWVYSCDPITGEIVPGNITWAGVTRKDTQVIRLTLDNGETLTVTPDHKMILREGKFIEAQNLSIGDSLMPFYRKKDKIASHYDKEYAYVFDNKSNEWKVTHRLVAEFFKDINKHQEFTFNPKYLDQKKTTIHHKDYNRFNNDPRNLQWMHYIDHFEYHSHFNQWSILKDNDLQNRKDQYCKIMSRTMHRAWQSEDYQNLMSGIRKDLWNDDDYREKTLGNRKFKIVNQELSFSEISVNRAREILKSKTFKNFTEAKEFLSKDSIFIDEYKTSNTKQQSTVEKTMRCSIKNETLSIKGFRKLVKILGYKSWGDLKEKIKYHNHKVVKIEWLDEKIDTGTITVDGKERWHSHHTFATAAGVFVKNSILEDYYFPVDSDGHGSTVDILPGGADLSMINDVLYFNNLLIRGMGIPSSYLPTGPEDSQSTYNDGRLGQAFIQELRFSNFCKRIQNILIYTFDYEFKLFCQHSGIVVESSQFEIVLEEPESFSEYRQIEKDTAHFNNLSQALQMGVFSKRYAMQRFGGMSEVEILENERLWREENKGKLKGAAKVMDVGNNAASVSLRNVGIPEPTSPENFDEMLNNEEEPVEGEAPIGATPATPAPPVGT